MTPSEYVHRINHIIDVEFNEAKLLEGDRLAEFIRMLGYNEALPDNIYYNRTNLMFTSRNDLSKLRQFTNYCVEILQVEAIEYDMRCYIVNYSNCQSLNRLLAGDFGTV